MEIQTPRWKLSITYRTDNGPICGEHYIEEIEDAHEIVENGPHWYSIERIVIKLNNARSVKLTVEQAEEL